MILAVCSTQPPRLPRSSARPIRSGPVINKSVKWVFQIYPPSLLVLTQLFKDASHSERRWSRSVISVTWAVASVVHAVNSSSTPHALGRVAQPWVTPFFTTPVTQSVKSWPRFWIGLAKARPKVAREQRVWNFILGIGGWVWIVEVKLVFCRDRFV